MALCEWHFDAVAFWCSDVARPNIFGGPKCLILGE